MKKWNNIRVLLVLFLAIIIICASAATAEVQENDGYEYYYRQLDANQKVLYRFILEADPITDIYVVELPERIPTGKDICGMLQTAKYAAEYDHPECMAWLNHQTYYGYDVENGTIEFELVCSPFYNADDQAMSEKLIDIIVAGADLSWDRYTKARYVSNAVVDALDYDAGYVFYSEGGRVSYYNSNIYCVNYGNAICGGFSKLYKAIADRIGLPCVEVGSVGHAWVHVQMEDGYWYGIEPQDRNILQGTNSMLGRNYIEGEDQYVLYNEFFAEDGSITQPERPEHDYIYMNTEIDPGSADVTAARMENTAAETIFTYEINADGVTCTITGFKGKNSNDLIIPEQIDGYAVTEIGNSAFAYAYFDGVLNLPDTIEKIGSQAFTYCRKLTGNLKLPSALKQIGTAAFYGCDGFTGELVFNEGLQEIRGAAFGQCSGLSGSLWLPDTLTCIESNAFYNCEGINGILHIPNGIAEWSAAYIDSCENISGFDVSEDHPSYRVYEGLLYNREMNTLLNCIPGYQGKVIIPEGVTIIAREAFYRCFGVSSISFPSTLRRIEDWGCAYLIGLTEALKLPEGLQYIGENAFTSSSIIGTLVYPAGVEILEDAFAGIQNTKRVIVEEGVTRIPNGTFWASTIQEIFFPSTLKEIGRDNFQHNYDLQVFGYTGTAAEQYVNSQEGRAIRAVFHPLVNGLALSEAEIGLSLLKEDNATSFQLTVQPYCDGDVIWKSKDASVAIVESGLVKAVSAGKTVVTAKIGNTEICCNVIVHDGVQYSANGKALVYVSPNYEGELIIPEGVEYIADNAIWNGEGITNVILPDSLTNIRTNAIRGTGYKSPYELLLPENGIVLEESAFCSNAFSYLRYPVNAVVKENAFGFGIINKLVVPEGVERLPSRVFSYSTISECYLPASLAFAPFDVFESSNVDTFYVYSGTFAETYVQNLQKQNPQYKCVSLGAPMNYSNCSLTPGDILQLTWQDNVAWESSNPAIASVSADGLVTAVSKGGVHITAKAQNGAVASCYVVVHSKLEKIELNCTDAVLALCPQADNKALQLNVTLIPEDAPETEIQWESSDTMIASVDAKGYVVPVNEGTTIITAATSDGKSVSCNVEVVAGHIHTVVPGVKPSCTETGLTEGKHCSVCNEVLVSQEVVPALGHTEVIDKAVNATCTESGLTEGKHCSVCNEVLIPQEVVPALGHTEVIDKAVNATCTESGLTEGKHCSVCNEVLVSQEVVPALGHTEVIDEAVAPTCTESGLTEGKHCSRCNTVLTAQTVVPALGHAEVKDAAVPATYITTGLTEGKHCARCGDVLIAQDEVPLVEVQYIITLPSSLKVIGEHAFIGNTFECVVIPDGCTTICAEAFEGNTTLKFVDIPASVKQIDATAFNGCNENLIFITSTGSTAEMYAVEHSFYCVIK